MKQLAAINRYCNYLFVRNADATDNSIIGCMFSRNIAPFSEDSIINGMSHSYTTPFSIYANIADNLMSCSVGIMLH
jgi:hypothetical protein